MIPSGAAPGEPSPRGANSWHAVRHATRPRFAKRRFRVIKPNFKLFLVHGRAIRRSGRPDRLGGGPPGLPPLRRRLFLARFGNRRNPTCVPRGERSEGALGPARTPRSVLRWRDGFRNRPQLRLHLATLGWNRPADCTPSLPQHRALSTSGG